MDRASVLAELRRHPPFSLLMMNTSLDSKTDGLELARQLRQCHPSPAIILFTTQSSEDLAIAALKAHVDDFLPTPSCSVVPVTCKRPRLATLVVGTEGKRGLS